MLRYAEWPEQPEPWLTTQWQTEKEHILLAEDGHIFLTCLHLVGTLGNLFFRNLVLDVVQCHQLIWYISQSYVQKLESISISTARVSSRKYFIPGCVGRGLDLDLRIRPAAPVAASGNPGFGPLGM